MAELVAEMPQDGNENRKHENSPLLYPNAAGYNAHGFIFSQQSQVELLDKSYGDGSSNEICAVELDQGKIDELANDYRTETCVSYSDEIRNESHKETVKNDGTLFRNEDESRCKSSRKRKTCRKMPKGIIIDLSKDIYDNFHSGITINIISMDNLVSKPKLITVSKRYLRSLMRNHSLKKKTINKMIDSSALAVFCIRNCDKIKKAGKSVKRKCKNRENKLMNNKSHPDATATINIPNQLKNTLNKRGLHVEDNLVQLSCTPDDILDSKRYHDSGNSAMIDIDNARCQVLNTGQTCVGARKYTANHCCSIFNDKRQEYHICDREDYNANGSDFNAEMQADWIVECFHPECIHAGECRCFHDSSEYYVDINMQRDCCPLAPMRTAGTFKNSALPKRHQKEEAERYESTNITPEFSTNGYSPSRNQDRCANCDGGRGTSTSTIRKCIVSRASVLAEPSESVVDLRNSRTVDAPSRCEIDKRPGKCGQRTTATATTTTLVSRDDERPNKSDSLKTVDTWDARGDDPIERCESRCVVAESSRSDRSRGMDLGWKQGSIETDVQQLDYKWKRRIATVDAGMRASVDCEEERDSRYKLDEAIRVQLRESAEIRKRERLQMGEATSQTRSDNTNVDGKRRETRDYSPWTSLQMGKIWSQVHDACKNVVKLVATSVGRIARDASKLERSQRNLFQVTDASLVENSCAEICEEIRDKNNLTRSKNERESEVRREREIGDANEYRDDAEASIRQNPRAFISSRYEMRKQVHENVKKEKNEKSCVFYRECEPNRYRDVVEFLPRNGMYSHDENVYPQFCLSESFTYLENSAHLGFRNRGGSDDGRNFAGNTEDKQKFMRHIYEESRSVKYHRNCISKKCACCSRIQESRGHRVENQNSQHVDVCHEPSVTTDRQTICADVSDVSRSNPPHRELQSSVSVLEDNRQKKMSEQMRSCKKMEAYENSKCVKDGAETERNLTSEIAEIVHATRVLSMDSTVHSQNNPNEPIASTSKETPLVLSGKSRKNPGSRSPFCTTTMKFWRKRPIVDNKIKAPFKRRRNVRRKESSSVTIHDSEMKITQIEPFTVQTVRESNKRRNNINVRLQTPDAIVAKILSEFLVSGEMKKRILMNITLESESDHDILDRKEVETQTSFSNITFTEIDVFRYSDGSPQATNTTTSKIVQCFVCDKRDCYEIKRSNHSITLEDALVAEYPETSDLNDYLAKRKSDIEIPP